MSQALGATPVNIARNDLDYLVELESESAVRRLQPNIALLKSVEARGVIVTARASSAGFDFISRFFAPRAGVDEDPVTGSAHCCLAPYWSERLGRSDLTGFQASRRGGVVRVGARGDRVLLGGQAVTVMNIELADIALPNGRKLKAGSKSEMKGRGVQAGSLHHG
jgi:predicted PhzF superfamily epimerase YddE/YHI9